MSKKLSRRTLLRGGAGAALALPWLEVMGRDRARAQANASHYCILYGGISLGSFEEHITPGTTGTNWESTTGLRPLLGNSHSDGRNGEFDYPSVKEEMSLISGLRMPESGSAPGRVGPEWHGNTHCPLLSGISINTKESPLQGPSADFLVHRALGGSRRHLKLRVQPVHYQGYDNDSTGRMSAGVDGNGDVIQLPPVTSPLEVHRSLFQQAVGMEDTAWRRMQAENGSVIDLVRRSADRLHRRLGTADRARMQRHFDEIRDLEMRMSQLPPSAADQCETPAAPQDPSIGNAWSDETTRAELMMELIYLAFACDRSAAASCLMTYASCYMTARHISGFSSDVHSAGHSGNNPIHMAEIYAWHIKPIARLIHRLRDTPVADGSLLDQSVIVFVTEAGWGGPTHNNGSHATDNMLVLLAGGRAAGHQPGRHLNMSNQVHPSSVIVQSMRMMGVQDNLGEITEGLPALMV